MTRKKSKQYTRSQKRSMRIQQILFASIAVLIIASFIVSLIRF